MGDLDVLRLINELRLTIEARYDALIVQLSEERNGHKRGEQIAVDRVKELEKQLDASERRARLFASELVEKNARLQALESAPGAMLQ